MASEADHSNSYRSEASISPLSTQPILAVSADEAGRGRIVAAITEGGGQPVPIADVTRYGEGPLPHRFAVLSWSGDEETLQRLAGRLQPGVQVVAVVPPLALKQLTRLLAETVCNHLVTDDERGMHLLSVTVGKFVSGDLFGIEKYVPPGAQVRLTRLCDYAGRTRAIDEVLTYAEQVGVRSRVRSHIGQVCEELLMNALYDAPIDGDGNLLFGEVDIEERLDWMSPRPVSIRYAATDTGFAVAVRDRFGRLDKATILRYIEKCLQSAVQIDRKTYGAGLGLYFILNAASHVVVNIAPGMATEVVCTFDRCGVRTGLRSFSIFVHPGRTVESASA